MVCTESMDIAYVFSILLIKIFIIYSKNTCIYIYRYICFMNFVRLNNVRTIQRKFEFHCIRCFFDL